MYRTRSRRSPLRHQRGAGDVIPTLEEPTLEEPTLEEPTLEEEAKPPPLEETKSLRWKRRSRSVGRAEVAQRKCCQVVQRHPFSIRERCFML
jgi:hypothetical protein